MSKRLWLWWVLIGSGLVLGRQVFAHGELALDLWSHVFTLAALALFVVGVRRHRPARPAIWYLFGGGLALSLAGDVSFTVMQHILHLDLSWPSYVDAVYLAAYPSFAAGLFILLKGRISGRDRAGLIDASIVATGLGLLLWTFVMQPIFDDQLIGTAGRLVSLGYPLGDLLLLFMLARLVASPGARTPAYRLLVAALAGQLTFNTVYALLDSYRTGGLLDLVWFASTLAWTAAALHPSMRSLSEVAPDRAARFSRWRMVLLAATSLLAPAALAYQGVTGPGHIDWPAIAVCAVVLFLLVVARMSGLLNQVQDQAQQLAALAHHDGLTHVPNRRAWDLELVRAMAGARRRQTPLTVAMLDLDHFKSYNDTHGHQAGDALLAQAAGAWRAELRAEDLIARYGGEEFTVLIRALPPEQAAAVVDRLRTRTPFGQTFSAGVATWDGVESPQHLVGRADAALYEAKRAGRNQVARAADPAPAP